MQYHRKLSLLVGICLSGALWTVTARAAEGVIEINHAKIMAGGGYPYVINNAGSYRLTSNLSQPDANTHVIIISHDNVSIDLNGFSITGSNVCSVSGAWPSQGISCSGRGSGAGIFDNNVVYGNLSIRNGAISGMGSDCVSLSSSAAVVDHVRVSHCGNDGIAAARGVISDSYASDVDSRGFSLATGAISHVTAFETDLGIYGGQVSISAATITTSITHGIEITGSGTVSNSSVFGSVLDGVYVASTSAVPINVTLINNLIYHSGSFGVEIDQSHSTSKAVLSQNYISGYTGPPTVGNVVSRPVGSNETDSGAF